MLAALLACAQGPLSPVCVCMQHEAGVGVLVMDETGSVGLDLSFVGWVFLMEPLADASLQAQVTARAHRMGATQAIHVETLVMKVTPCSANQVCEYADVSCQATLSLLPLVNPATLCEAKKTKISHTRSTMAEQISLTRRSALSSADDWMPGVEYLVQAVRQCHAHLPWGDCASQLGVEMVHVCRALLRRACCSCMTSKLMQHWLHPLSRSPHSKAKTRK